jgi:hypothetical protein
MTIKKSHEKIEIEEDTKSYIDKLQSQFKNLDLNKMVSGNHNNYKGKYITHTSITRNWYPKPSSSNSTCTLSVHQVSIKKGK